jgi:hypothetical protein
MIKVLAKPSANYVASIVSVYANETQCENTGNLCGIVINVKSCGGGSNGICPKS